MSQISAVLEVGKRNWAPRERLMVSEWLAKANLWDKASQNVRLGNPITALGDENLSDGDRGILRVKSRYADAIVFGSRKVMIVEAKIIPRFGAVEALLVYKQLFLSDPLFKEHHGKPVELVYLYAIYDPVTVAMCEQLNIRAIEYRPRWLPQYLKALKSYERGRSAIPSELIQV